jgi:hypothetical protein
MGKAALLARGRRFHLNRVGCVGDSTIEAGRLFPRPVPVSAGRQKTSDFPSGELVGVIRSKSPLHGNFSMIAVSLVYDSVPVGYFSIFKEIADLIVTLIRGGAPVGHLVYS